jgi:hypothetical protein
MTGDMTIHRQLMRLHGFGLMKTILTQMADERSVVLLVRKLDFTGASPLML